MTTEKIQVTPEVILRTAKQLHSRLKKVDHKEGIQLSIIQESLAKSFGYKDLHDVQQNGNEKKPLRDSTEVIKRVEQKYDVMRNGNTLKALLFSYTSAVGWESLVAWPDELEAKVRYQIFLILWILEETKNSTKLLVWASKLFRVLGEKNDCFLNERVSKSSQKVQRFWKTHLEGVTAEMRREVEKEMGKKLHWYAEIIENDIVLFKSSWVHGLEPLEDGSFRIIWKDEVKAFIENDPWWLSDHYRIAVDAYRKGQVELRLGEVLHYLPKGMLKEIQMNEESARHFSNCLSGLS
jgi:hypothetical protein